MELRNIFEHFGNRKTVKYLYNNFYNSNSVPVRFQFILSKEFYLTKLILCFFSAHVLNADATPPSFPREPGGKSTEAISTAQVHCSGCRLWRVCAANNDGTLLTTHVLCNFEHAKICILIGVDSSLQTAMDSY